MSGVRRDPLTGRRILVAPSRAARPHDVDEPAQRVDCPFCEGCEETTPPETDAVRPAGGEAGTPGWTVRVVPNKFPVIDPDEGVHEVVVNTPRHITDLVDLREDELTAAVAMWSRRLAVINADPRGLWPFCFLNQGAAAGASLQHTHAQIVGLPFSPPRLVAREKAFAEGANPIAEDLVEAGHPRFVAEHGNLVAWIPDVPPLTGTVRIAPREPSHAWSDQSDFAAIATLMGDVVRRIDTAFESPAINLWLHQGRPSSPDPFHWHLDVISRLGTLAGLELGTGVIAVAMSPEATAERLRI